MRPRGLAPAITIVTLLCLTTLTAGAQAIGAWRRNQVGVALIRTLADQTDLLRWPHALLLRAGEGHAQPDLQRSLASLRLSSRSDYVLQGVADVLDRNWLAAENDFQRATMLSPSDPVATYWLGAVQYARDERAEAVVNWTRADALPYFLQLGSSLMQAERYEEAWEWYQVAISLLESPGSRRTLKPDHLGRAYGNLGKMANDRGDLEDAVGYYERAVAEMPQRTLFHYELAQLYVQQGRFDDAVAHIQTLMRIEPVSAGWPGVLGNTYLQAGDLNRGEQAFQQALQTGNDENVDDRCWHARAWYGLSMVYNLSQSWEASLNASLQSIRVNQGLNPGWQHQFNLNFKGALAAQPERLDWYLSIGEMYEETGDAQAALEYYREAAQRWPDNIRIQEHLANPMKHKTSAAGICP